MREERVKLGPLFDVRLAPAFYGWLDAHTHKSSLKCYSGQTDLLLHIVGLCVCAACCSPRPGCICIFGWSKVRVVGEGELSAGPEFKGFGRANAVNRSTVANGQ